MQLTVLESSEPGGAKLLFSPSFQAISTLNLEALNSESQDQNEYAYRRNADKLVRYLGEVSAAGWELFEMYPAPYFPASKAYATRYLFRKPR